MANDGWAIFDSGPSALQRLIERALEPPKPKPSWPRVVNEALDGDPFVKVIECEGKRYRLDEAALIEAEEANYRAIEMEFRLSMWRGESDFST
jgi:hypothetical protein